MNLKNNTVIFPSEEWVYFKIYSPVDTADTILSKSVYPAVKLLKKNNQIVLWFFIRYSDEQGDHLRVRFKCSHNLHYLVVIKTFLDLLNMRGQQNKIGRVQIDTYEREIERYGQATIENVETVFSIDSLMLVKTLSKKKNTNDQWAFALGMVVFYLTNFSNDNLVKSDFINDLAQKYRNRLSPPKKTFDEINNFYNSNKPRIIEICRNPLPVLSLSKTEIHNIKTELLLMKDKLSGNDTLSFQKILGDIIHLSLNRTFQSNQNKNEFIIYELLAKGFKNLHYLKPS